MTDPHRRPIQSSEPKDGQEWHDSQTLFLLTCYDVWSATPPRHCAAIFETMGRPDAVAHQRNQITV
jgi:hypothetical protein